MLFCEDILHTLKTGLLPTMLQKANIFFNISNEFVITKFMNFKYYILIFNKFL